MSLKFEIFSEKFSSCERMEIFQSPSQNYLKLPLTYLATTATIFFFSSGIKTEINSENFREKYQRRKFLYAIADFLEFN